jgi:hypothetical protein
MPYGAIEFAIHRNQTGSELPLICRPLRFATEQQADNQHDE